MVAPFHIEVPVFQYDLSVPHFLKAFSLPLHLYYPLFFGGPPECPQALVEIVQDGLQPVRRAGKGEPVVKQAFPDDSDAAVLCGVLYAQIGNPHAVKGADSFFQVHHARQHRCIKSVSSVLTDHVKQMGSEPFVHPFGIDHDHRGPVQRSLSLHSIQKAVLLFALEQIGICRGRTGNQTVLVFVQNIHMICRYHLLDPACVHRRGRFALISKHCRPRGQF